MLEIVSISLQIEGNICVSFNPTHKAVNVHRTKKETNVSLYRRRKTAKRPAALTAAKGDSTNFNSAGRMYTISRQTFQRQIFPATCFINIPNSCDESRFESETLQIRPVCRRYVLWKTARDDWLHFKPSTRHNYGEKASASDGEGPGFFQERAVSSLFWSFSFCRLDLQTR